MRVKLIIPFLIFLHNFLFLKNCESTGLKFPISSDEDILLIKATIEIISKAHLTPTLNVIEFEEPIEQQQQSFLFLNDLLAKLHETKVVLLTSSMQVEFNSSKIIFGLNNLLILHSELTFDTAVLKLNRHTLRADASFIVVLYGHVLNQSLLQKLLDFAWKFYILKFLVITKSNFQQNIDIFTYSPFTYGNCGKSIAIHWNTFNKNMGFYFNTRKPFFDALHNMNNCPLIYAAYGAPPFIYFDNSNKVFGIEGKMIKMLGELMNFTIILKKVFDNERDGVLTQTGKNGSGACGMLARGEANFTVGASPVSFSKMKFLSVTRTHFTDSLVFTLPRERELTGIEKMILVFNLDIWIVIVFTYLLIISVYLITKSFCGELKLNFIFGRSSPYPLFTTLGYFLGVSTQHWPKRNFARTFWTLVLMYGFIIRSVYQACFIKFSQMHIDSRSLSTIDDLVKISTKKTSPLHIFVSESLKTYLEHLPHIEQQVKIVKFADYPIIFREIRNTNKGSLLVSKSIMDMINLWTKKYEPISYTDNLVSVNYALLLTKSSCLVNEINKHVGHMIMSGLINQWIYDIENVEYVKNLALGESKEKLIKTTEKQLKLQHLYNYFWIVLIGLPISTFIFILEILSKKFKFLKKIFNLL